MEKAENDPNITRAKMDKVSAHFSSCLTTHVHVNSE